MRKKLGIVMCTLFLTNIWTGILAQTCRDDIPPSAPDSRFTDNLDGTVTDTGTGLMWKKCTEGLSGSKCSDGGAATYTWPEALQLPVGYVFAGHRDWRLPNLKELESLVEQRCYDPAINAVFFPNTPLYYVWSSSPDASNNSYAWWLHFGGSYGSYYKTYQAHARLVREGH